jgi:hypothetical protein
VQRVNARLDAETAAVLEQLVRVTGLSVTDIIKRALLREAEAAATPVQPVVEAFAALIGCFDGGADLSSQARQIVPESLARKHAAS